uniref:Uncharacterized protein n=1 Tax=Arundo donax TaxID=35708 RepID=A0A0A9GW84_ARUDO
MKQRWRLPSMSALSLLCILRDASLTIAELLVWFVWHVTDSDMSHANQGL